MKSHRTSTRRAGSSPPKKHPPGSDQSLRSAGARLKAAEALFRDFTELTPYRFTPFTRSFDSWADYERWRRAQTNPWYR